MSPVREEAVSEAVVYTHTQTHTQTLSHTHEHIYACANTYLLTPERGSIAINITLKVKLVEFY